MAKKTLETLSFEEVLTKLESARKEYKDFDEGQRKALYQSMQRVAEAAVLVVADENIKIRYRKKMGAKDALRGALTFIFDAKTTPEKKDASKRVLALWFLIEKLKVSVEDIAKAIPKNGGVEKLASLVAKSRQAEAGEDGGEDEDNDDQEEEGQRDEDEDEPEEEADETEKAEHKLGKRISVGLSPKLIKKLNRFADNTRIKIIGYVQSSDEAPIIRVEKILAVSVKKKSSKSQNGKAIEKPDEDEGDWED